MKKICNGIDAAVKYILVALTIAICCLSFYQCIGRYVFGKVPIWVEELARYLFVYASCFGAAIGIKEHIHIGIDILVKLLPKLGQKICAIIVQVILLGFDAFITYWGINLCKSAKNISQTLHIRMGIVYFAIVILGVLGAFYSVREIIRLLKNEDEEEADLPIT